MGYGGEVHTFGDAEGVYTGNGVTFATEKEAAVYVEDLAMRWTSVKDFRVVGKDEPVNREIKFVEDGPCEMRTIKGEG